MALLIDRFQPEAFDKFDQSTIFDMARFAPGETVLVHGGSSGIGRTAIQLVKAFGGEIFVTCGTTTKGEACQE